MQTDWVSKRERERESGERERESARAESNTDRLRLLFAKPRGVTAGRGELESGFPSIFTFQQWRHTHTHTHTHHRHTHTHTHTTGTHTHTTRTTCISSCLSQFTKNSAPLTSYRLRASKRCLRRYWLGGARTGSHDMWNVGSYACQVDMLSSLMRPCNTWRQMDSRSFWASLCGSFSWSYNWLPGQLASSRLAVWSTALRSWCRMSVQSRRTCKDRVYHIMLHFDSLLRRARENLHQAGQCRRRCACVYSVLGRMLQRFPFAAHTGVSSHPLRLVDSGTALFTHQNAYGVTWQPGEQKVGVGSNSVFSVLIWVLQHEWLFLNASVCMLHNFHGLRVPISYHIS